MKHRILAGVVVGLLAVLIAPCVAASALPPLPVMSPDFDISHLDHLLKPDGPVSTSEARYQEPEVDPREPSPRPNQWCTETSASFTECEQCEQRFYDLCADDPATCDVQLELAVRLCTEEHCTCDGPCDSWADCAADCPACLCENGAEGPGC